MKITSINGIITAQAETLEDAKKLIALGLEETKARIMGRKPGSKNLKRKPHKKACLICGKKVRYMKIHFGHKHKGTSPEVVMAQMIANPVAV